MDDFKLLETAGEVIDALGENRGVRTLLDVEPSVVSNWRKFGKFPANTYVAMTAALAKKGKRAPETLWGMRESAIEGGGIPSVNAHVGVSER